VQQYITSKKGRGEYTILSPLAYDDVKREEEGKKLLGGRNEKVFECLAKES
jgi:hypothetical protein